MAWSSSRTCGRARNRSRNYPLPNDMQADTTMLGEAELPGGLARPNCRFLSWTGKRAHKSRRHTSKSEDIWGNEKMLIACLLHRKHIKNLSFMHFNDCLASSTKSEKKSTAEKRTGIRWCAKAIAKSWLSIATCFASFSLKSKFNRSWDAGW